MKELLERIHAIEKLLERNTLSLEHHVRRTDLAEENVEMLRKDVRNIENHVIRVDGIVKFITFLGVLVGILVALLKLI